MPLVVVRDHLAQLLDEVRTLGAGPHEAHVAPEHVPQLRQLVEPRLAHQAAEPGDPRVVLARRPDRPRGLLGVRTHRAPLQELEVLAAHAHARLAVEHGPRARQPHAERRQHRERQRQDQQHGRDQASPARFTVDIARGFWKPAEKTSQLGRRSRSGMRARQALEEAGRLHHADPGHPAAQQHVDRQALAPVLLRHDDQRDVLRLAELRQVGERAEHARVHERAARPRSRARSGSPARGSRSERASASRAPPSVPAGRCRGSARGRRTRRTCPRPTSRNSRHSSRKTQASTMKTKKMPRPIRKAGDQEEHHGERDRRDRHALAEDQEQLDPAPRAVLVELRVVERELDDDDAQERLRQLCS